MQLQVHLQESFVDEFRWAYDSSRDGLSDGQPNSTLALLPSTLVTARPTAIHHVASLSELRLAIAACFLETNYGQARLSILTSTSAALPTPCFPSIAIVLTLCAVSYTHLTLPTIA